MCQDRHLLFAPCGHSLYEERWICKRAKSFIGVFNRLVLQKKCEPVSVIAIVIDWCPVCKVVFEKLVTTIGVHPSENERVRPVDPEVIGPVAFQCYDQIKYNKIRAGSNTVKRKVDSWELRCLQAEVRRLKPACVWIEDYEHEPAETLEDQLNLCNVSLVETKHKAYVHGLVP
ncbi:hypothetical protein LB503_006787 [Fusarium chuoi]|nr:hypothetical protein LB503_006787 [Fusarium chuoi]